MDQEVPLRTESPMRPFRLELLVLVGILCIQMTEQRAIAREARKRGRSKEASKTAKKPYHRQFISGILSWSFSFDSYLQFVPVAKRMGLFWGSPPRKQQSDSFPRYRWIGKCLNESSPDSSYPFACQIYPSFSQACNKQVGLIILSVLTSIFFLPLHLSIRQSENKKIVFSLLSFSH